jgi:hypothetical protein
MGDRLTAKKGAAIRGRHDDPSNCCPPRAKADITALLGELDAVRAERDEAQASGERSK